MASSMDKNRTDSESEEDDELINDNNKRTKPSYVNKRHTPVQEKLEKDIHKINDDIIKMEKMKRLVLDSDVTNYKIVLNGLHQKRLDYIKKLHSLRKSSQRMRNYRLKHKDSAQEEANEENNETVNEPKEILPKDCILETLKQISIIHYCNTKNTRRANLIKSLPTIDSLVDELRKKGFTLIDNGRYKRIMPLKCMTPEGKRHIETVAYHLNNGSSQHEDSYFAAASLKYLKELAVLMGNDAVIFVSQDETPRISLGLAANDKESPILTRLEYNNDLRKENQQKSQYNFKARVFACCEIKSNVTFSGPTFISICNENFNAENEFQKLTQLSEFKSFIRNSEGNIKPVLIITLDQTPSQSFTDNKLLQEAASIFTKYDFDAVFVVRQAPGHSASDAVQRRMVPLGKDLASVLLNRNFYGSNLDEDFNCEKTNLLKIAQTISDIWSECILDDFPVFAKCIKPKNLNNNELNPNEPLIKLTEKWTSIHVRHSEYMLQIIKCDERSCCKEYKSTIRSVLNDRFIPAPILYVKTSSGIKISDDINDGLFGTLATRIAVDWSNTTSYSVIPYDYFCPSVHNEMDSRVCKFCDLYCISSNTVKGHERLHSQNANLHNYSRVQPEADSIEDVDFEIDDQTLQEMDQQQEFSNKITLIDDLKSWLKPLF